MNNFLATVKQWTKSESDLGRKVDLFLQKLRNNFKYESGGQNINNCSELLKRGHGICQDYSNLTSAMCRIIGIPSHSASVQDHYYTTLASHCIVMMYSVPLNQWAYIEPQNGIYAGNTSCVKYHLGLDGDKNFVHLVDLTNASKFSDSSRTYTQ